MTEPIRKIQRWLDIIAYLVGRRFPVPVDELMEHVPAFAVRWREGDDTDRESVRRTFERDKDELRTAGIPLQTVHYTTDAGEQLEGYRINRRDFYLPYLRLVERTGEGDPGGRTRVRNGPSAPARVDLSEEDARVALEALLRVVQLPAFPLAREARSAFRKLAFDLDPEAFTNTPILFVEPPGAEELLVTLRRLSAGLLARKRVQFRYRGMYRGEETARDVAAYGLLFQHGHWYLIGHDALRDGIRVFRVGRIQEVMVNARRPKESDYQLPADFTLEAYVGREAWELGDDNEPPLEARVRFRFPASLIASRNRQGVLVEQLPNGGTVRSFAVHQVEPFLRWILSLEGDAHIESPAELAAELTQLADRVAGLYRRGPGGGTGDPDGQAAATPSERPADRLKGSPDEGGTHA